MANNPLGQFFRAVDGNLAVPFDEAAIARMMKAESTASGKMEVAGTAYVYGAVGWFPFYGAMRLKEGALRTAPGRHRKYRDAMFLYAHNAASVLGRQGNNTLDLKFGDKQVEFAVRLNSADPQAQSVWAKIQREDVNASSIGFIPVDGEWVEGYDTSLDAEEAGEKIDIFEVSEAYLIEVSAVAQGAFAGATSYPASAERVPEPHIADADGEAETAGILDGDEPEPEAAAESAPADLAEGSEGDVGGVGEEDFVGAAQPGDLDDQPASGDGETELAGSGWTMKDVLRQMPHELKGRL